MLRQLRQRHSIWTTALCGAIYTVSVLAHESAPTVNLSYGLFQGVNTPNISLFLGMPYAQPPLGSLRFAPPLPPQSFDGVFQAAQYGAACPQQRFVLPSGLPPSINLTQSTSLTNISEDCLFVNVIKPQGATPDAGLPVIFWIFGGGFETGDTSEYPGNDIVERSIALNEPVVFVSANYRLNAFGFLAGEEVQQAGASNVGFKNLSQHIAAFGGDPSKVTIWGESAGAWSVGLLMVLNGGDTGVFFRAGVMESGSPYALRNYTAGQPYYDMLADSTGCAGQEDTLDCLRQAPYDTMMSVVNATPSFLSYTSLNVVWQPRLDGDLFVQNPQRSVQMGLYAKVTQRYDRTDEEFLNYVGSNYLPLASASNITAIGEAYPSDPSLGSPFGTGAAYNLTPEYKRLAAFQGDWGFVAPRRFLLSTASKTQDTWAFLYRRNKAIPYLGSYHSSDIPEFFTDVDYIGTDALINFVTTLNPNAPPNLPTNISLLSNITWPQWGSNTTFPPQLTFQDPAPAVNITTDTYRAAAMDLLTELSLQFP